MNGILMIGSFFRPVLMYVGLLINCGGGRRPKCISLISCIVVYFSKNRRDDGARGRKDSQALEPRGRIVVCVM
jgi:hypothetical protein